MNAVLCVCGVVCMQLLMRCVDDRCHTNRDPAPVKSCEVFDVIEWPWEVSIVAYQRAQTTDDHKVAATSGGCSLM
jgi:hypothetical protein